jgi:hypothetical protein
MINNSFFVFHYGLNVIFITFPSSLSASYPFSGPLLAREVMCSLSILPGGYLMIYLPSYPLVWYGKYFKERLSCFDDAKVGEIPARDRE